MPTLPIAAPAGYYPPFALAFADSESEGVIVDADNPLPVDAGASVAAAAKSGAATRTTVASGTASVTILAANAERKGASIYNSDASALYLDMSGGTAAATRCQYSLAQGQTLEVPFGFTGAITGVWAGDGAGGADVAEYA